MAEYGQPTHRSTWAATRCAHAAAAREGAEYMIQLLPTSTDRHAAPGEHITAARRARLHALQLLDMAVLTELAGGATWDTIADRLNLPLDATMDRYERMWESWLADHGPGPATDAVLTSAAELDLWYQRVAGVGAATDAVSAGLY